MAILSASTICVYAAYLPNRRHSHKLRVFLDFLQSHLATVAAG